ncbi:16S rRNA (cytosine(1402)-N(4))-methyltransferase, partial [Nocardia carnea]|uniref:16S rRNA (cytosine(1402)-N(4))-methyltransferase n=1 Tax=Nocardia carnea TaxID=37328 RepID=UPI003D777578
MRPAPSSSAPAAESSGGDGPPHTRRPPPPGHKSDATLGLGGHAEYFLRTHPALRLVGLDRDADALAHAAERLRPFQD